MTPEEQSAATRIIVVDDHGVVRAGLTRLLNETDGLEVVAEAADAETALEKVEVKRPDVVILDIELGNENGLDLVERMLAKSKTSKILVLSMHDEPEWVKKAFDVGVHGYLIKEAAESELVSAVHVLSEGATYIYPPLGARMMKNREADKDHPLTDRELEISRLLALGHTNQEVAKQLYLSVRTVETHRSHLMSKLNLKTRAELVQWALDHGLLGSRI